MPFQFTRLPLDGLVLVQPRVFDDERGYFLEWYRQSDFRTNGIPDAFVQDNHSFSARGVLRGMHYQLAPRAQGKLVRVITGSVWDVAVDIRAGSPTLGHWHAVELSAVNRSMLYLPVGFAHGFLTLQDDTHLCYKCTAEYDPDRERGVVWNDVRLQIDWPRLDYLISARDRELPALDDAELL